VPVGVVDDGVSWESFTLALQDALVFTTIEVGVQPMAVVVAWVETERLNELGFPGL
jgi:hypothetical protein